MSQGVPPLESTGVGVATEHIVEALEVGSGADATMVAKDNLGHDARDIAWRIWAEFVLYPQDTGGIWES